MNGRPHNIRRKASGALMIALLWTVLPATTPALATIPSGYDLLETDPSTTHMNLNTPADFFGPGSDPFTGLVAFTGEPLGSFMGRNTGDADTVVQRKAAVDPMPGSPATVPIEIVALNLVSAEPIVVRYGGPAGTTELWDVRATLSPTRPSQGQMIIRHDDPLGGTFDSQLVVLPVLTFTRLSDGQTTTLDGAGFPDNLLTFVATGVPWRSGCIPPALSVAGLNDGFCPTFTTTGNKVLTVFAAQIASHGVRPAQPAQEHFKCYLLERAQFNQRDVQLADAFGTRTAAVTRRHELCNPVQKNNEPLVNKRAHLVCYDVGGADPQKSIVARNQFGSQRLMVGAPRRLCVPSQKRKLGQDFKPITSSIDHRQCYSVTPLGPLQRQGAVGKVTLKDQFGSEQVDIGQAVQLCVPVQKDNSQIRHAVHASVCYAIVDDPVRLTVEIKNQFERRKITTKKPVMLCVPSAWINLT